MKWNYILSKNLYVIIIVPDKITEELLIQQYTYTVYSDYDILLEINENDIEEFKNCESKKKIFFIKSECGQNINLNKPFLNAKYIFFYRAKVENEACMSFKVSKELIIDYIAYLQKIYPYVVLNENDEKKILDFCGCNISNVHQLIKECYYTQKKIQSIQNLRDVFSLYNNREKLSEELEDVLNVCPIGINIKIVQSFLDKDQIRNAIQKEYIYLNDQQIIPNICLHAQYENFPKKQENLWWETIELYVDKMKEKNDETIIDQVFYLLKITSKNNIECLQYKIFKIEQKLFKIYRFYENEKLLQLIKQCETEFLNEDIKIRCLIDEAILYEDIEEYEISKQKFKKAQNIYKKNMGELLYIYIQDEYCKLLEKTTHYREALKHLFVVQKFYVKNKMETNLINVRNRIGLNLCLAGEVKNGTNYLEPIFYGEYEKNMDKKNLLSCEVANNLSICYMEAGKYNKSLELQEKLYTVYLEMKDAPMNYASDILQNKGNVYLYEENYKDACICFEQALKNEMNPISKGLILENYVYAKSLRDQKFEDGIFLLKERIVNENGDDETRKMLAELYFANGNYDQCVQLCEMILKQIVFKDNLLLFISVDVLRIMALDILHNIKGTKRIINIYKIEWYKYVIKKYVGVESPYYIKIYKCEKKLKN